MYCSNCGKQISDGVGFCPNCGEKIATHAINASENENMAKYSQQAKMNRKIVHIIVGLIGIVVAIVLLAVVIGNMGYKPIVSKYFKSIENKDSALMLSIVSEAWKKNMQEGWYMDEDDLCEIMERHISECISDYGCGNDIKINYRITDVYKPTEDELYELESDIYELSGYYVYDRDDYHLNAAYALEIQYTVTGNGNTTSWTMSSFLVIKENGKWRTTWGALDGSWY